MKLKTIYNCENCGYSTPKWIGKCPDCETWNSFIEDVIETSPKARRHAGIEKQPQILTASLNVQRRLATNIQELDHVLGGTDQENNGIVPGSLILLSGEPGIGKSTLTLQICAKLAAQNRNVLYISGEESPHQIASRACRMAINNKNLSILGENNLENILTTLSSAKPDFLVIDSIQVISSHELPSIAGSINQVRYCAESFMKFAKQTNIPVLIIGHVNKEGNLAGPKILEHLVDTVLLIEGDRYQNLRVIRSQKNRFGSTNEIGLFEMTEDGLIEVKNGSALLLEGRKHNAFGSAITATIEGSRSLLLEVQALTYLTAFGYPKRTASGFDTNRLQLLLAVIQKHLHFNINVQDVYINVIGGLRLNDPVADNAVAMAVISSLLQQPLPSNAIFLGEIGLAGEFRRTPQLNKRLIEAEKIGFRQAFVPMSSEKLTIKKIAVSPCTDIGELLKNLQMKITKK